MLLRHEVLLICSVKQSSIVHRPTSLSETLTFINVCVTVKYMHTDMDVIKSRVACTGGSILYWMEGEHDRDSNFLMRGNRYVTLRKSICFQTGARVLMLL